MTSFVEKVTNIYQNWCNQTPWCMFGQFSFQRRRDSTVQLSSVSDVYWIRNYSWRIWSRNWKLNILLRIYPVELTAELETGSRLPTDEYTPPDTTQLDSTCSVFNFSTKSVGSRRELVANSMHTAQSRRVSTRQLSRVGGLTFTSYNIIAIIETRMLPLTVEWLLSLDALITLWNRSLARRWK